MIFFATKNFLYHLFLIYLNSTPLPAKRLYSWQVVLCDRSRKGLLIRKMILSIPEWELADSTAQATRGDSVGVREVSKRNIL